ncbi:hypothetical protein GOP47_0010182 [Adiantum capillus-veneris]|uniref:Uncharacterized protein n=1 Tax=Adiantum capillus-veneris TaxID=13818 RepID=A0A9D4UUL5_ADICA|nr:hypothetical protein GOP47_0010182 [Adiantum capillus-veneris]
MQATAPAVDYNYARNSPNSAFSRMAVCDEASWSRPASPSLSRTSSPFFRGTRFSRTQDDSGRNFPMDWEPVAVGPRTSKSRRWSPPQRNSSPADFSTNWRGGSNMGSKSASPSHLSLSRPPRLSATNYEKRMSASLATQQGLSRRNSIVDEVGRGGNEPAVRERIEAELARQWAYTLGAELAHHVVGVFADPRSPSYNKRWNSETATRVFGANPWAYLTQHKFFVPPFVCPEVVKSMPLGMQDIHSAVRVVSKIVTKRNELQHVPFPEDLYLRIRKFKKDKLMRHLIANDRDLYDFLSCEKLLADWFIGTPRIYRLMGQLLYNMRGNLAVHYNTGWKDALGTKQVADFLTGVLSVIDHCNNKEWYKHEWPTTIQDLAEALDQMELTDTSFGPKLEKDWRRLDTIASCYQNCVDSRLLTPAVKKFCSLPCALLENIYNLGLREMC